MNNYGINGVCMFYQMLLQIFKEIDAAAAVCLYESLRTKTLIK